MGKRAASTGIPPFRDRLRICMAVWDWEADELAGFIDMDLSELRSILSSAEEPPVEVRERLMRAVSSDDTGWRP